MRLRACLGVLLLATGACASFPERARVEVGDGAVELERPCPPRDHRAPAPAPVPDDGVDNPV